jgi:hypothetical protein
VVDAVAARIPTWKAGLINTDAESLTKTTLSAILVHVSMVCCLSAWAIQQIDQRRIGDRFVGHSSRRTYSERLAGEG